MHPVYEPLKCRDVGLPALPGASLRDFYILGLQLRPLEALFVVGIQRAGRIP
jgi:hypothetical protein